VEDPNILVGALAILGYALVSRRLNRWWISMPAALLVLGVLVGPLGLGLVSANVEAESIKAVAELTLALMLFHDAVRIDLRALRSGYSVPLRLLGIGLPLMLVLGTAVAYAIFPEWGLIGAALVATMLAPTDAALGDAVVSDTRVPVRIRQGLSIESGLNDGLSVPIFLVLLAVAAEPGSAETGALAAELIQQIGIGVLSGVVIGGVGGALFRFAVDRELIERVWRLIAITAIAFSCFVAAAVLGGSGFIGAFVGGVAFGLASEARSAEDNELTDYLGTIFDAISFFLLGAAVLPFALQHFDWRMLAYAVLSLVVIRMVSVAIAMLRSGARRRTVAFMGWFGPRGLATLVFAVLLIDENVVNGDAIAAAAVMGVVLSVFAHGFTAPPLVRIYTDWWNSHPQTSATPMEDEPVHEHRVRMLRSRRERKSA
jgi:NhaP-type Na+/H+ or K+/H+ antiporter